MPRKKTLPRTMINGRSHIVLYQSDVYEKLNIDNVPTREILTTVLERLEKLKNFSKEVFEFEIGYPLSIQEDEGYWIWGVLDTPYTSSRNKSLAERCHKLEELIVERTNEYARQLTEVYDDIKERP